jgi:tetratricopeptide (TPR) repeat protein
MEASLEIRRAEGDNVAMGALYSNLAIVAEYEGDYESSVALNKKGLELRVEAGDTVGIAISEMNLGVMLQRLGRMEEARARQEASLELRRQIGDPRMIALGEHNLGILLRELGDYDASRTLFASALRVQRDQRDTWALAFMLEDVAVLATLLDEPELALRLAGAAAALREATQSQHGVVTQQELDRQLAPAHEALGDRAEAAVRAGGALGLDEAVAEALAFCESGSESGVVIPRSRF